MLSPARLSVFIMLSVIFLSVVLLCITMLNVVMLSALIVSVFMLSTILLACVIYYAECQGINCDVSKRVLLFALGTFKTVSLTDIFVIIFCQLHFVSLI